MIPTLLVHHIPGLLYGHKIPLVLISGRYKVVGTLLVTVASSYEADKILFTGPYHNDNRATDTETKAVTATNHDVGQKAEEATNQFHQVSLLILGVISPLIIFLRVVRTPGSRIFHFLLVIRVAPVTSVGL